LGIFLHCIAWPLSYQLRGLVKEPNFCHVLWIKNWRINAYMYSS